jgi:hypothetical protein
VPLYVSIWVRELILFVMLLQIILPSQEGHKNDVEAHELSVYNCHQEMIRSAYVKACQLSLRPAMLTVVAFVFVGGQSRLDQGWMDTHAPIANLLLICCGRSYTI